MLRGRYGKPFRPPPDGWTSPRKVFFGGLYQHINNALNNLPAFVNTTQVQLQPGQVGPPQTRNANISPSGCESSISNGLPQEPWIGLGAGQGLPPILNPQPSTLNTFANTFTQQGTNSLGLNARLRGFKNVQACRQWHGCFGWTSHDPAGLNDQICNYLVCDTSGNPPTGQTLSNCPGTGTYVPTYQTSAYELQQPAPDQTKYLTCSTYATLSYSSAWFDGSSVTTAANASGAVSVDPNSGKITSTLSTNETDTIQFRTANGDGTYTNGPIITTTAFKNGAGNTYNDDGSLHQHTTYGATTVIDSVCGADVHNGAHVPVPVMGDFIQNITDVLSVVTAWSAYCAQIIQNADGLFDGWSATAMPLVSNVNSYSSGANVVTAADGTLETMLVEWTRTTTTYSWNVNYQTTPAAGSSDLTVNYSFTGTLTLSNPNTAADIYADAQSLLGCWNLDDDAQYPPRTDGVWQVAPLVSREEQKADISPLGFIPYLQADYRNPIVDANGNSPWTSNQNPPPTGWVYAPNNHDSAGNPPTSPNYGGPVSWNPTYAGTAWFDPDAWGFIYPNGFDQSNSTATGIKQFALTGLVLGMPMPAAFTNPQSYWYQPGFSAPANADFQNFFDFLAIITRACTNDGNVDVYNYGYGEWCYDAISRTGAQLPHRSTQWTPNNAAYNKPPYAYLIQGDKQLYGTASLPAWRNDALWAQKCCEIQEIWPSQDFFRPAGNDRFAPDETVVNCISNVSGSTLSLTSTTPGLNPGDTVGLNYGTLSGIYTVASASGGSVTLNTPALRSLPTGFALPSGDTNTALWKVRFPNAPAIEGRDVIASLTASGSNTIIALSSPEVNLMTDDAIDICSTAVAYDAYGNVAGETMTVVSSNVTVTRIDDSHFQVSVAIASLTGAAYIVSHGAPNWYWDDNGRKGDFVAIQWLYDYRTNAEYNRLYPLNPGGGGYGVQDCTEIQNYYYWSENGSPGGTPPTNAMGPPTGTSLTLNNGFQNTGGLAAACTGANYLTWDGSSFSAQGAIQYVPCCPCVIAITPNGETWKNAVVIPFPATFAFDDRYGARWQAEIEQAMQDLLYQTPHTPCNLGSGTAWTMDNGTCETNTSANQYYAFYPLVEARINLPGNGGNGQNETAPALPAGITIGYVSPVSTPGGLQPPGMIGWDTSSGNPVPGWTPWGYRLAIEESACAPTSCQFNYVGIENLACVSSYAPPPAPAPALSGLGALT